MGTGFGRSARGEVGACFLLPASDVLRTSLSCVTVWTEGGNPELRAPRSLLPEKPGLGEMLSYGVGALPPGPDSGVGKTLKQKAPRCGSDLSALFSCVTQMQTSELILKVVCILSLLPPHVYVSALVQNLLPLTSHNYLFSSPLSPLPPHHWSVNTDLTFLHIPPCSRRLTPNQEKAPPFPPPSPPQSVTQEHHHTAVQAVVRRKQWLFDSS